MRFIVFSSVSGASLISCQAFHFVLARCTMKLHALGIGCSASYADLSASRNVEQWRRLALHLRRLLDSTRKAVLEPSQMILHPHAPEQQNDPQYYDRYRDGTAR